jgi:predicted acylesterase/phospholipase RssA
VVFAALTAVRFAIGDNPAALAFLVTRGVWVTALALQPYRRDAKRPSDRRPPGMSWVRASGSVPPVFASVSTRASLATALR